MRHINPFPAFSPEECDDLRKKIIGGIAMETFTASSIAHRSKAKADSKEWVKYPCWIHAAQWEDGKGFKKFKFKGHTLYIHRTSCQLFNGHVLSTHLVDHLCRVHGCCQPAHLEAVTPKENILRGAGEFKLLRKGEKPPCAMDINPDFWKEATAEQFDSEFFRRQCDNREVRRYHFIKSDGPLPAAPLGFVWMKVPADATGDAWVMNPKRTPGCYTAHDAQPLLLPLPEAVPHGVIGCTGPNPDALRQWVTGPSQDDIINATMNGPSGPAADDPHDDPFYLKMPSPKADSWLRRKWDAVKAWLDKPVGSKG